MTAACKWFTLQTQIVGDQFLLLKHTQISILLTNNYAIHLTIR